MADDLQNDPLTPAVAPAAVPDIITTREGGDTATSSSASPAPGELDAINRAEGAGLSGVGYQEQADAAQAKADLAAQPGLDEEAQRKAMEAQVAQNDLGHLQDLTNRAQILKSQADEQLGGANPQFHNLLQNESGGKKALVIAGLLGTGLSGNVEAQKAQMAALDNIVKNDFNVQRENYTAKLQYAKLKGENVNDLYSQYEKYQGLSHAAEQKANEAILAKVTAEAKRNGIPVDQALKSAAAQGLIRNIEQSKANSLAAFTRHAQTTRQINPVITDTSGKPVKGGATKEPLATFDPEDFNALVGGKVTATGKVVGNVTREAAGQPNLGQTINGAIGGGGAGLGGPANYRAGESDPEKEAHDVVGRLLTAAVKLQTQGKRPPKREDFEIQAHALIPTPDDSPSARERKINNLKRLAAMPGVMAGPAPASPGAPAARPAAPDLVMITNKKTGERKQVSREQAKLLGAI